MEEQSIYAPGSLVQVTNYGPFRRLNGTIQLVDTISDACDDPFCFYLVALAGTQLKEPMWFAYDEVELITEPLIALEA